MATQSLYRRYRPRRFAELKGQDHVVRALRTSVAEGREGQAYLFSGPRGTGKTSSARILAKVLNCENPQDGEPCCECASCLAVEQGTSYDVHELDAASNNGVDAMRDLIEKASLGTPGRHKVYILDEVHMLSRGAEAALLKTLEEPPPHVVFVLATTDPQKMSDTIRSRTQHLQFHLLPVDTLQEHVQWVASDAGLDVTEAAIEQVLAQGAGSARDTLSALELVSNAGGDAAEVIALDEFVEAMIEHDPGRALTMAATAISRGHDPRTLTEQLIGYLRNAFLTLMAPDLVQLPTTRVEAVTDQARRVGPPALVRGIEQLGGALTEMRHAPDPRVLLDVAIVRLTSEHLGGDIGALAERLARLERRVAEGAAAQPASAPAASPTPAGVTAASAAAASPAPADPETGRKTLGGRARREPGPTAVADATATAPASPATEPVEPAASSSGSVTEPVEPAASSSGSVSEPAEPAASSSGSVTEPAEPAVGSSDGTVPDERPSGPERAESEAPAAAGGTPSANDWEHARAGLRGMARAVFSPAEFVASAPGALTLGLPNDTHRQKCEQHRPAVEAAVSSALGTTVSVELVVGGGGGGGGGFPGSGGSGGPGGGDVGPASETAASAPRAERGPVAATPGGVSGGWGPVAATAASVPDDASPVDAAALGASDPDATPHLQPVPDEVPAASGRAIAEAARVSGSSLDPDEPAPVDVDALPDDGEVDLDDLADVPPDAVRTPMDRLAEAFPGSELIDDTY